jgi:CheY-like chemotaxis protein
MAAISCTLLVDDDETTNYLNQSLLRRMAVTDTVLVAVDGYQALELLHTHCAQVPSSTCPALILLDLKMPRMNGLEFLEAYAQQPTERNSAVVIIMLTTSLNPRDVSRMENLPIAGYLNKPLTRDKIDRILHEHFDYSPPLVS